MRSSEAIKGILGSAGDGRKIVLGVCSSIAAVEVVKLARELIRHGADIHPIMTDASTRIIHPHALEFATGRRPVIGLTGSAEHVEFFGYEDRADALLIAPATANILSKIASGIADDALTTTAMVALGSGASVIIAPSMHRSMVSSPAMERAFATLKEWGVEFIMPRAEEGKAKMAEIDAIVHRTLHLINDCHKRALVITGATAEPIDDMRVITNRSTGNTGIEIAKALYRHGIDTEIWYGHTATTVPDYMPTRRFTTVSSLISLVEGHILDFDLIVNAAAISDYTLKKTEGKIKSGKKALTLRLTPTEKVIKRIIDILESNGVRAGVTVVGFKAESRIGVEGLYARGRASMAESGVDMVVANLLEDVKTHTTRVHLILSKGGGKDEGNVQVLEGTKNSVGEAIAVVLKEKITGKR